MVLHSGPVYGESTQVYQACLTVWTRAPVAASHPDGAPLGQREQILCPCVSFSDRETQVQRRAEKTRSLHGWPGGPKSQATAESALLTAWVSLAQHNPGPKGPAAPCRLLGSRPCSPCPGAGSGGLPASSRGARPAEPAAARLPPVLPDQQAPPNVRVPGVHSTRFTPRLELSGVVCACV